MIVLFLWHDVILGQALYLDQILHTSFFLTMPLSAAAVCDVKLSPFDHRECLWWSPGKEETCSSHLSVQQEADSEAAAHH